MTSLISDIHPRVKQETQMQLHTRFRGSLIAVALLLGASLIAGCGGSDASDAGSDKLRLAYVPGLAAAPVIFAQQEGIFEDNGLEVELTPTTNLAILAPALDRQYDIVYATPADLLQSANRNLPITVIAGQFRETSASPQTMLVVGKDSDIEDVADLRGKRVAAPTLAGTLYASLQNELMDAGLTPDDVTVEEVPFPNMLDQLDAGAVDAILTAQPFLGAALAAGNRKLVDPLLSAGDPAILGMWASSPEWVGSNQAVVDAFRASLDQAIAWAEANPDEARQALADSLKISVEALAAVPFPDWTTDVTSAELEPWLELLKNTGQIEGEGPDLDALVSTR